MLEKNIIIGIFVVVVLFMIGEISRMLIEDDPELNHWFDED